MHNTLHFVINVILNAHKFFLMISVLVRIGVCMNYERFTTPRRVEHFQISCT